jgi:hypothetical protein
VPSAAPAIKETASSRTTPTSSRRRSRVRSHWKSAVVRPRRGGERSARSPASSCGKKPHSQPTAEDHPGASRRFLAKSRRGMVATTAAGAARSVSALPREPPAAHARDRRERRRRHQMALLRGAAREAHAAARHDRQPRPLRRLQREPRAPRARHLPPEGRGGHRSACWPVARGSSPSATRGSRRRRPTSRSSATSPRPRTRSSS